MEFIPRDVLKPQFDKVYIFARGGNILNAVDQPGTPLPLAQLPLLDISDLPSHYIGDFHNKHCFIVQLKAHQLENPVAGFEWQPLRHLLGTISDERFQMLGRALQVTRWERDHQYCGVCGTPTQNGIHERARVCEPCGQQYFPRISPCVICLVYRGEQCLLARHEKFKNEMFSTLAGFIEPGENAEQAVEREILEEVGVKVKNIRYHSSQPWPFPGQLMLGFVAEYASGDIRPDGIEIVEADWFSPNDLPLTPPNSTISGRLIEYFLQLHREALL